MKPGLMDDLLREPGRFEFVELVRLLEHALQTEVGAPSREPHSSARIAFSHSSDLAFPVADVASLEADGGGGARVGATFLGLLGTASPLTPEWTEEVLYGDDDGALGAFYDTFHHRALSLLFSAWKVHALEGGFDLSGSDGLSKRLRSLAGVDGWTDAEDEALAPMAAVGLADYQRGQPQAIDLESAEGLLRRLYPAWDVRLRGGIPRFEPFTARERARLGQSRNRLGDTLVYGDGSVEAQTLLRIRIGPVDGKTYESLMPGGKDYGDMERLTRRIFAGTLDVEIDVHVAPEDAPVCKLGGARGARLGVDARYAADRTVPVRARVRLLQDPSAARRVFV
ncbi:MAG TPA: type VI secretion system baseplate subunit TssG [Polyangiaceae bacterium]|jgi:type VI secretion system protein ImpH